MLGEGYSTPSSTGEAGDLCSLLAGSLQVASSILTDTKVATLAKGLRFSTLIYVVLQ